MKRFVLLFFLFPMMVFAQDYQTVRSDFVHFFEDENGQYHGMNLDSVGLYGSDSVLFNYLTLRYPDFDLIDAYVPSWLGEKTIIKPNGDNLFFNSAGDTILIKTLAQPLESWNLFDIDSLSYLEGTVAGIGTNTILDSLVEIKVVALQAKDLAGTSINHPMNGITISISKTLGIVQGFDFYLFPENTTQIELVGMEGPDRGVHRLSRDEVYDFQVGDEFHYLYEENLSGGGGNPYWEKRIERVISVDNNMNHRTIGFEIWKWIRWFDGQPSPSTEIIESSFDTDSLTFDQPWLDQHLTSAMPSASTMFDTTAEYAFHEPIDFHYFQNLPVPALTFQGAENAHYEQDSTGIWTCAPSVSGWDYTTRTFGKGIGKPYWTHQIANGFEYLDEVERLVYFKKGNEEWGTPYSISEIMSVGENTANSNLRIYPNPIKQGGILQLGDSFNQVEALDLTGKLIYSGQNLSVLDTESLTPGIYLLKTTSKTNSAIHRLIVTD